MIKVGAVSLGWSGTPLLTVFEQLAAMGGACIEINGEAEKHHGMALTEQTAPEVKARAVDAGLEIGSLSGYSDFAQMDEAAVDRELERLLTTCRVAARMEVPVVRAFVGALKPGHSFEALRPTIVAAFRRAARECEVLGVKLGIENHGRLLNDGRALAELLEDIGASNVGLTLDTGNFSWAGHGPEATQADLVAALPKALNVHVKDGVWRNERFEFVAAGEGDVELRGLLQQLRAGNFGGMVYSEYEGAGDFLTGTKQSIRFLRGALATL